MLLSRNRLIYVNQAVLHNVTQTGKLFIRETRNHNTVQMTGLTDIG